MFFPRAEDKPVDSLYICNWMGNVTEHVLDPRAKHGADKITDDSPLDVEETPRAQWILSRCSSKKSPCRVGGGGGGKIGEDMTGLLFNPTTDVMRNVRSQYSLKSE